MLRNLWCVQIAVVVIALGLIAYPWRDKPAKRRFGVVAFVGFGVNGVLKVHTDSYSDNDAARIDLPSAQS
jgi:predicted membrane channel-forming protein YqfA (hemolysin III family)